MSEAAVANARDEVDGHLTSINAPKTTAEYLREMWDRREFALEVPLEELRTQHRTTLLGNVWHLGNPLLTIAVFYLVFGTILRGSRPDNFLLWMSIAIFAFRATQSSVMGGAGAVIGNIGLIRAIRFPRALLPISVVTSQLFTFAFELGVYVVLLFGAGFGISRRWLLLPLVVVVHTMLNLGGAFIAARLNDSFRDVQQIIPFLFQLLRYLSGVMIPIDALVSSDVAPSWARTLLELNPLVPILDAYRWIFIAQPVDVGNFVRTALLSGLVLVFGFRFFRAAEWRYGLS